MRRVMAQAPGSCGEFIQGMIDDEPCLVSCPVDLFSRVEVREGPATRMLNEKAAQMLDLVFCEYGLPRSEKHNINVSLASEIPMEKGMASSTADLSAMALGLGRYYDLDMDADRVAQLCVAIEPTDNIMYPSLNLFDHMQGNVLADFGTQLSAPVLIVEFKGRVNTVGFHNQQEGYTTADKAAFGAVLKQFESGLTNSDLDVIGAACTASARLNQKILYKPHLDTMVDLAVAHGGHGIITGHSGTVIGVLYTEATFDYQGFMGDFLRLVPKGDYDALFLKNVIAGGLTASLVEE